MYGIYLCGLELKIQNIFQGTNAPPYISNLIHSGSPNFCEIAKAAKILYSKFRKPP